MSWNNITPAFMLVPIETELRELVAKIRTKPVKIKDIMPLLIRAADEITRLRARIHELTVPQPGDN